MKSTEWERTSSNLIFSVKIASGKSSFSPYQITPLISFCRYTNKVCVERRVYKNLKLFTENKDSDDDLFDRLSVRNEIRSVDLERDFYLSL